MSPRVALALLGLTNCRQILGIDDPTVPPVDALACADDSALEPNDDIANAFPTNVDAVATKSLAGLAICPRSDIDFYEILLSVPDRSLEAVITFDATGGTLEASIRNAQGTSIANATPTAPGSIRASGATLPAGTYFIDVHAAASDPIGTNNYKLVITASGP